MSYKLQKWLSLGILGLIVLFFAGCTIMACKDGLHSIIKRPTKNQWKDTSICWEE